jgi:hypothetical protein
MLSHQENVKASPLLPLRVIRQSLEAEKALPPETELQRPLYTKKIILTRGISLYYNFVMIRH